MSATAVAAEPAAELLPEHTAYRRPRIVPDRPAVDPEAAERAAADLLTALGMDLTQVHLADTPGRMARALLELTQPEEFA